jgi:hypothetical protein
MPERVWRPNMERAISAFEDLRCDELIEGNSGE